MRRFFLCLLFLYGGADAVELRNVDVDRKDGRYFLTSEVWFDAGVASVYAVFLDYDLSSQFSSFIVESRNLEPDENGQRGFYIRNAGCVLFFCKSFERSGSVEHERHRFIRSTADPERSDFHASLESWTFEAEGEGTVVEYHFEFKPKFWNPPLIGPYVMQRKLESDSVRALYRIEALAQGRQP
jgi:hypothetical protein